MIRIINHEAARPGGRLDHVRDLYIRPAYQIADMVLRDSAAGRAHRAVSPAVLHFLVGHGAGGIVSLPALAERFPGGDGLTDQARRRLTWCCAASCTLHDTDRPVPPGPADLAEHIAAMSDEPLMEGDEPLSIWMLVKSRDSDGDVVWGVRNAGEP